jgi:serine/threonine-protein phosphatase 6 regulatory subunit 3
VHQILTGRVDGGLNRELTIALFRDAQLMHRIVEGQRRNDAEWWVHSRRGFGWLRT